MAFGKKRESKELFTGFTKVEVMLVNPTAEEIQEFYGMDEKPEKEPVYIGSKEVKGKDESGDETIEDVDFVNLAFYMLDTANRKFKHTIQLQRKPFVSNKNNTIKEQYINQLGKTSWVEHVDDLEESFTNFMNKEKEAVAPKEYRKAFIGEVDLTDFIDKWLDLQYFDKETGEYKNLLAYNVNDLFDGDVSIFRDLIKENSLTRMLGALAIVTEQTSSEGTKTYQNLWKKFTTAQDMKLIMNAGYNKSKLAVLLERKAKKDKKKEDYLKSYENYVVEACDPAYGISGSFKFAPISVWKEEEDFIIPKEAFSGDAGVEEEEVETTLNTSDY